MITISLLFEFIFNQKLIVKHLFVSGLNILLISKLFSNLQYVGDDVAQFSCKYVVSNGVYSILGCATILGAIVISPYNSKFVKDSKNPLLFILLLSIFVNLYHIGNINKLLFFLSNVVPIDELYRNLHTL